MGGSPRKTLLPRHLAPLIAALVAAPLPALAQAWPGGAVISVASVRTPVPHARTFAVVEQPLPTGPRATRPRALNLKARTAPDADTPPVDIRAKADWSDDQGFRASPTQVSYKLRF